MSLPPHEIRLARTGGGHSLQEAFETFNFDDCARSAGDIAEPAVAEVSQVFDRPSKSYSILHSHAGNSDVRNRRTQSNYGKPGLGHATRAILRNAPIHQKDSIDLSGER